MGDSEVGDFPQEENNIKSFGEIEKLGIPLKEGGYKLDLDMVASYIFHKLNVISFGGKLWIYDWQKKIYRVNSNDVEKEIQTIREELDAIDLLSRAIPEVKAQLLTKNVKTEWPFNTCQNAIPVRNGILFFDYQIHDTQMAKHGPIHLFTYKLDVDYNKDVDIMPAMEVLEKWVEKKDVTNLIQAPAQALLQTMTGKSMRKAYLFMGPTFAAKSSYVVLLNKFVGREFVSEVTLHDLANNRFASGTLESKILNIVDDLAGIPLESVENFKRYTGIPNHDIERKGQQSYPGMVTCTFIYTCNTPPVVNMRIRKDSAFWNRWNVVRFPYLFEQDTTFCERTFTDDFMSSFLNCVIKIMHAVEQEKKLVVSCDPDESMDMWLLGTDPLVQFVEEGARFGEAGSGETMVSYDKDKLFEFYLKVCDDEGVEPNKIIRSKTAFSIQMQNLGFFPANTKRLVMGGDGKKIPHNIKVYRSWKIPLSDEARQCVLSSGQSDLRDVE